VNKLSPDELKAQCPVKINRWIDLDSEDARMLDPDRGLTKKFLKIGMEGGLLFIAKNGEVWGKGRDGVYFPFHFELEQEGRKSKLIGYRICKKASN